MKLTGKTILITGASSGIGKYVALEAAKQQVNLVLAARSLDKLEAVKSEAQKLGAEVLVVATDVTKEEDITRLFEQAVQKFGTIDVVFSNAGLGYIRPIYDLTMSEISQILDVNVKGMILVAKVAADYMKKQSQGGHIILTSSVAGVVTLPEWSVYVASKWAVLAFADCIRPELKPYNVKVTTVHPGPIRTEFFNTAKATDKIVGKMIEPDYVAREICKIMMTNKERLYLPKSIVLASVFYRLFPRLSKFITSRMK